MTLLACALGALLLAGGVVTALVGGVFLLFVPQLLVGGVLLVVGLAIERWRYKPIAHARPDPSWTDTGERFVDPETQALTAVYFDARTGERHYLAIGG